VVGTVTNVVSPTIKAITRTWEASDACGNTSTIQQTITVDTTIPTLNSQFSSTGITLTWPSPYVLQWSSSVTGPYTDVPGATSPYFYNTVTNPQKFFRIVAPSLTPVITTQPQSQTVGYGDAASLSVGVSGLGPFTYQWQKNGANVAGATGSSLSFNPAQFNNAGLYTVVVANANGSATSSVAVLNVVSKLVSQFSASNMTLTWAGPFILQSAPTLDGPYTDVPGATSPYTYSTTGLQRFFRLRSASFSLLGTRIPTGEFSLSGPGLLGCNFVIQASTNLKDWVDLGLTPSPCNFVDNDAAQYPHRFYRAALAH
jgi:hypothetical protein